MKLFKIKLHPEYADFPFCFRVVTLVSGLRLREKLEPFLNSRIYPDRYPISETISRSNVLGGGEFSSDFPLKTNTPINRYFKNVYNERIRKI
jgi:hypothetical protein